MAVNLPEEVEMPDPQAASAMQETSVSEAYSGATPQRGDPTLALYFNDLSSHPVLTQPQESEIAHRIQDLEVREWVELFSHPPMLTAILGDLRRCLNGAMPKEARFLVRYPGRFRAAGGRFDGRRWAALHSAALRLGRQLRDLDCDRVLLNAMLERAHFLPKANGSCPPGLKRVVHTEPYRRWLERLLVATGTSTREKEHFILANLRLVVSVARRYHRGRMSLIDMIQEGNIGLMKAVDRFDIRKGYRFSTYASWWIRHAINRALADKGRAIRIPVHMLDTHQRIQRVLAEHAARSGEEPLECDVAAKVGIDEEKVHSVRAQSFDAPLSLDRPLGDDEGRRFVDVLICDEQSTPLDDVCRDDWSAEIIRLLDRLPPIEARILRWRFGLGDEDELTLKEIGDKFRLSRERIRQLQEQALTRLRRQIRGPF
jgi:RNA polymerase primary sigma factor